MVNTIPKELIGWDPIYKVPFIYDVYTSNMSFLQIAKDLKTLGVKNNKFFLKIYDPSLIGVDVYSQNLTPDIVAKIHNECLRNIWYYLREVARIPSEGGALGPGSGNQFLLTRANLASTYLFTNHIPHYEVIPRQIGKTQSALSIVSHTFLYGTTNTTFSFMNKSQEDANLNLSRLKKQIECLPIWMQQKYAFDELEQEFKEIKGTNNVKSYKNSLNGNIIVCKPSAKTEATAEGIGRGITSAIQLSDEVEFTDNIGTIFAASGPAYVSAAAAAAKSGAAYCRMFLSTPGNLDSKPVEEWNQIRSQMVRFTDNMYNMTETELQNYVRASSSIGMVEIEYQYYQLGKDNAWFEEMCKQVGNNKIKIKRELLLYRIRGATNSPFEPDDIDIINGLRKEPIRSIIINKLFNLDIYAELDPLVPYIVGMDCATGKAGDNNAITVIDPYDIKPVAEFKSPYQGAIETCNFVRALRKMIPRCILCIENNSVGTAIIDMLKKTECYPNLYYDSDKFIVGSPDERLDDKGFLVREAANRKCFGIATTVKSREVMMAILARFVTEFKDRFVTKNIIIDLNNLVKTKSGKIQAANDAHDDSIMSFLIGLFVYYHGTKLSRYGLFKGGARPNANSDMFREPEENVYEQLPEELKDKFEPLKQEDPRGDPEFYKAMVDLQRMRAEHTTEHAKVKSNIVVEDDYELEEKPDTDSDYLRFIDEMNDL